MKSKYYFLILITLLYSCDKLPVNGHLDGMWQLQTIEYANGKSHTPISTYYNIQLQLIKLTQIHNSGSAERRIDNYLGRFKHTQDSLIVYDLRKWIYREEETPATPEQLAPFGIEGTSGHFGIEELTSDKMILRSPGTLLTFRKF